MKIVERFVIAIFSIIALFAFAQAIDGLFKANGWEPLKTSDWAAWIQAVGSILAIVGAFAVSRYQARKDLEKDRLLARAESQKKLQGILGIVRAAGICADSVHGPFEKARYDRIMVGMLYEKDNFDDAIAAIKAIPLHEIGSEDSVMLLFFLKANLLRLQQAVEKALSLPFEVPGPPGGAIAEAFLEEERELAQWVLAYWRKVKNDIMFFCEHPEIKAITASQ